CSRSGDAGTGRSVPLMVPETSLNSLAGGRHCRCRRDTATAWPREYCHDRGGCQLISVSCLERRLGFLTCRRSLHRNVTEVAPECLQRIALPLDLYLRSKPQPPQNWNGRAPALRGMLQQKSGDEERQIGPS